MSQVLRAEMRPLQELLDQIRDELERSATLTRALIENAEQGRGIKRNELEETINEVTWLEISLRSLKELLRNHPSLARAKRRIQD
jgi:hypothetical protein